MYTRDNLEYLYRKTLQDVFGKIESLEQFLNTMAATYKYTFADQLVIHGQLHTVEAVATKGQWLAMGREVNRFAVAAARFSGAERGVENDLFDVADTSGLPETYPKLWQLPEGKNLAGLLGMDSYQHSDAEFVYEAVEEAVGAALANNSMGNIENAVNYQDFISAAACYVIDRRLGLKREYSFLTDIDIELHKLDFSAPAVMADVGMYISMITQTILKDIERSIKHEQRQHTARKSERKSRDAQSERGVVPVEARDADLPSINKREFPRQFDGDRLSVLSAEDRGDGSSPESHPIEPAAGDGRVEQLSGEGERAVGGIVRGDNEVPKSGESTTGELYGSSGMGDADGNDCAGNRGRRNAVPIGTIVPDIGLTEEYTLDVIEALKRNDELASFKTRVASFFVQEADSEKRVLFLKGLHGQSGSRWLFYDRICTLNTHPDAGIKVVLEASATKSEISCILPWQQAERIYDYAYGSMDSAQEEQQEQEKVVKVTHSRKVKTPPLEQLSFFPIEPEESGLSDEDYLRQCLQRGGIIQDSRKRIMDAVQSAITKKELAAFMKKEFGWGGRNGKFSDGVHYFFDCSPKGAAIRFRSDSRTGTSSREVNFSWTKVAGTYIDMVEDGTFVLTKEELEEVEQEEHEAINSPLPEPEKPTLADLLSAPETVQIMLIENHKPRMVEVERTMEAAASLVGEAFKAVPLTPDGKQILLYDEQWLEKRLLVNIEWNEQQILFGSVVILQLGEDGVPISPDEDTREMWIKKAEHANAVFSEEDIAACIIAELGRHQEAIPDSEELYGLVVEMSDTANLTVMLVAPGADAYPYVINDSPGSLERVMGTNNLRRYPVEEGIDLVYLAEEPDELNRYVDGAPFYGTFLLLAYGEDGAYISLSKEQIQQCVQRYSMENAITTPLPLIEKLQETVNEQLPQEAPPQPKTKHHFYYANHPEAVEFQSGSKARFKDNVAALKTLHTISQEERNATPDEQATLAKYAGWGGLPQAFDSNNADWAKEFEQLKSLLEPREYTSARASTLTSYYTPTFIIEAMYGALQRFRFTGGRILEPSVGTGRFFGAMPEELAGNSQMYAVELDNLSARLTSQLYPNVNIHRGGYEGTEYRDNSFDVVMSNIPFGDYQVADPRYDKKHFLIHDYYFAKSINLVRPGGIVAFITSTGTMDKKDSSFRAYMAERAELIGAVRLPNTVFKTAGTDVICDIVFLQKREEHRDMEQDIPSWVYTDEYKEDQLLNRYFTEHPEMVLGELQINSWQYGFYLDCVQREDGNLSELLEQAFQGMEATITPHTFDNQLQDSVDAPPGINNYTYTIHEGKLYYREDDRLICYENLKPTERQRIVGMCGIRDTVQELIRQELSEATDTELEALRGKLNSEYDKFRGEWGALNSQTNARLFRADVECNFLLALESKQADGNYQKTDIFHKRTVAPYREVTEVDNAHDALTMSLNNQGGVNFTYMKNLYGKDEADIAEELGESVFLNPDTYDGENLYGNNCWELKEEYLSGNVRRKLEKAKASSEKFPELFQRNITALEASLPTWLEAGEIEARFGAPWIAKEYYVQFMYETFNTPVWLRGNKSSQINIQVNSHNGSWHISNKNGDSSVTVWELYGTKRANAYELLEDLLNLKATTIRDRVEEKKYLTNKRETQLARAKQKQIRNSFSQWIFNDPERRKVLVEKYNEMFNCLRVRQYDGSHLLFPGLNPGFKPYEHQRNAVARILDRNQNTLLDHDVGYGKTATMILGAYEQLRLGLAKRCLFAVPNHIVQQFGMDIYSLYPHARAMIVTEKDFEKANRQKFLSRVAFSDVDMIVMGHTQFERIAMSQEYREQALDKEVFELSTAIESLKMQEGTRFTVRQMEQQIKTLEAKLEQLQNEGKKDQVIPFEHLGVDCLFVDEADVFKNGYIFTKMHNVAGIGQATSQRAADMLMKCRYINENGGKIVFATGTPISNALSEMYVLQRYLQEDSLHERGIYHFDQWVASFAEATTSLEMAPEGKGFRERTRLCKYFNIPELLQMYHTVADVKSGDMVKIKKPDIASGQPVIRECPASWDLQMFVEDGVKRCKDIRNGSVDPQDDNMLKFTHEAKLAGIDMRLLNPHLNRDPEGKISACTNDIYKHYCEYMEDKAVQLVFCDVGTPKADKFNVYDDLKLCLTEQGIPEEEIAFIHDAKNNRAKEDLFRKCRSGEIRVLVGSTEKCGAGTNIQNRLIAEYELDCPYRPRDIIQRQGRIIRQGNQYDEVHLYRYITKGSFDAYLWGIVSTKWKFISQIRNGTFTGRTLDDKDETQISFEVAQAVASGDPDIMRHFELEQKISEMETVQADRRNQRFRLQDELNDVLPKKKGQFTETIRALEADRQTAQQAGKEFQISINGKTYDNRNKAGIELIALTRTTDLKEPKTVGEFRGFTLQLAHPSYDKFTCRLIGESVYSCEINPESGVGTCTTLENMVLKLDASLQMRQDELAEVHKQMDTIVEKLAVPIEGEEELQAAIEELAELDAKLTIKEEQQEQENDQQLQEEIETQVEETPENEMEIQ